MKIRTSADFVETESDVDYVQFEIEGKKVSLHTTKDGQAVLWFEDGLAMRSIGATHVQLYKAQEGKTIIRCSECSLPMAIDQCDSCGQSKKTQPKWWRTS